MGDGSRMNYEKIAKVISLLMIVFILSNIGVVIAKDEEPEFEMKKSFLSDQVMMYLLKDLNVISSNENVTEITRGDCLKIITNLETLMIRDDPTFYAEENLVARLKLRNQFPIADWDSLSLEEKNILDRTMTRSVFYGEEKDGELYANFDQPITYYEALSFLLRWYRYQCLLSWRIEKEELNVNWLDYAESTGILYGRIPDFVDQCTHTKVKIPEAEKERIRKSSQDVVPPEEFYRFLCNMLFAPTYDDDFTTLTQDSMINHLLARKMYEEGILDEKGQISE